MREARRAGTVPAAAVTSTRAPNTAASCPAGTVKGTLASATRTTSQAYSDAPAVPAPVASSTAPPAAYGIQGIREWWTTDIMANSTATSYAAGACAGGSATYGSYRRNCARASAKATAITVAGRCLRASRASAIRPLRSRSWSPA
ncbi:hypothetical protein [Streptomyces sp. NPDC102347]|uniref:hypothetical protein n=1 Tax=Streptomyces sp. NPDC102347 TaxID=3366157 RepID=UPI0038132B68